MHILLPFAIGAHLQQHRVDLPLKVLRQRAHSMKPQNNVSLPVLLQGLGSRKGPDKGKRPIPREESNAGSQRQLALLQQTVNMLGRLVLRHEDAHAIQRANSGYVLLLSTGQATESMASCGRSRRSWAKRLRLCESFSGLCCWRSWAVERVCCCRTPMPCRARFRGV